VIPVQSTQKAVAEIERCAADKRFVQVLMLVSGDNPLGRRVYWPIYEACQRSALPSACMRASNYTSPSPVGWGSIHTEDYVGQSQAFQTQLTSLIIEGCLRSTRSSKVVMLESGLPGFRPISGGCTSSGAGADGNPVGTARRWKLCAATCAFRCSGRCAAGPAMLNRVIDHMQSDD